MNEKKTETLTIRITTEQKEQINAIAQRLERTPANLVYLWVKERLEQLKERN